MILEPKKIKSATVSTFPPSIAHWPGFILETPEKQNVNLLERGAVTYWGLCVCRPHSRTHLYLPELTLYFGEIKLSTSKDIKQGKMRAVGLRPDLLEEARLIE